MLVKYSYGTNGTDLPNPVYLKAETNSLINAAVSTTIQIKFVTSTPQELLPPFFVSKLQPIYMVADFFAKSGLEKVSYKLPEVKDPLGLDLKPIMITNLADFKFLSFNSETRVVTVDPSLIGSDKWDGMVTLKVKVENKEARWSEYSLAIVVTNTGKQEESPIIQNKTTSDQTKAE